MGFSWMHKGRGDRRQPLVFLPGWGFDGQVGRYGQWPPMMDLLVPGAFCHGEMAAELHDFLISQGLGPIVLVGWSMGAHVAWQFAGRHPELVASLTLLAGRRSWPASEIAAIKADLASNQAATLQTFYRKCFLGHKKLYVRFVEEVQDDYLARHDGDELMAGLDFLAATPLTGTVPEGLPVRVIHGRKDVVAPVAERPSLAGATEVLVEAGGHLLFTQPHIPQG